MLEILKRTREGEREHLALARGTLTCLDHPRRCHSDTTLRYESLLETPLKQVGEQSRCPLPALQRPMCAPLAGPRDPHVELSCLESRVATVIRQVEQLANSVREQVFDDALLTSLGTMCSPTIGDNEAASLRGCLPHNPRDARRRAFVLLIAVRLREGASVMHHSLALLRIAGKQGSREALERLATLEPRLTKHVRYAQSFVKDLAILIFDEGPGESTRR